MSPTAKVLLAAQRVYVVAPLGGTTHPKASPTTWVVAAELCSKAATAATKRKTMFNLLAIALLCCRSGRPCVSVTLFLLCFLNFSLVLLWGERILLEAHLGLCIYRGRSLEVWEPCAARWMPRNWRVWFGQVSTLVFSFRRSRWPSRLRLREFGTCRNFHCRVKFLPKSWTRLCVFQSMHTKSMEANVQYSTYQISGKEETRSRMDHVVETKWCNTSTIPINKTYP